MLSERLKAAMESVAKLPPETQDRLAGKIEVAIDNALWDTELGDPRHDEATAALVARARQQAPLPFPSPRDMEDDDEEPGVDG